MKKIDENELKIIFQGIKNGNKANIELLYKNYHDIVYGIAFSILKNKDNSEDVTQNVFTKLLKLDSNHFPTQGEASWLYTVTKNEVFQFLRKQKTIVDIDDLYSLESESNEIDDIVDMTSYYKLLENLKPIDREIISLRILSDFTFDKIAQMLNMPIGTVEWRYYKSLHCIKLSLSNLAAFIVVFFTIETVKNLRNAKNYNTSYENEVKEPTTQNLTGQYSEMVPSTLSPANDDSEAVTSVSNIIDSILSISMLITSVVFIGLTIFFAIKKKIIIKK